MAFAATAALTATSLMLQPIPDYGSLRPERPQQPVEFKSAFELNQTAESVGERIKGRLRGGEKAVTDEWPVALYATIDTPRGPESCTAALVGKEALLTAAHCVPFTNVISFGFARALYWADCMISERYGITSAKDPSADYALCKVRKGGVSAPPGTKYESIDITTDPDQLVGKPVILTGFGCISNLASDQSQIDGFYRIGRNIIVETSSATHPQRGTDYYRPNQMDNLITMGSDPKTGGDPTLANLCPGDSGGPAYRTANGSYYPSRQIVAINSGVLYADKDKKQFDASLLSATGAADFVTWARNWAHSIAKVELCGVETRTLPCRR